MKTCLAAVGTVIVVLGVSGAPLVSAQQVNSFQQLQLLVKPGDKVTVVSPATLKTTVGRIRDLSPSALRLTSGGLEHIFSEQDVFEIRQRRADSVANGAKWGALISGGGASLIFIVSCSIEGCAHEDVPFFVAAGLVYTGIGAGIGVGIDAMIQGKQTIYRNPNRTAPASGLHVAPVLSGRRKGILLSLTF